MRKKLFVAAVCILILLLSFILFLEFREYRSFRVPIHAEAQTVLKVNTDKIIKDLIFNYGTKYREKVSPREDKSDKRSKNTGIYFPANIFIYNIHSKYTGTYFTCLPIYDAPDFKKYMQTNYRFTVADSSNIFRGISEDEKTKFLGNGDYVVFSYSSKREQVDREMQEILFSKNILSQDADLIEKLKTQKSAISLAGNGFQAMLSWKGNSLNLHAELEIINRVLIPATKYQQALPASAFASLSLNAIPPARTLKSEYLVNGFSLERDSVLKYYEGNISLQFGNNELQTDTIISYSYDDNFEMQEMTTTQEIMVPQIQLSLSAKRGLYEYLQQADFINEEGHFNKAVFPLYPVKVSYDEGHIFFTTQQKPQEIPPIKVTENILNLKWNISDMDSTGLYAFIKPYTTGLQYLSLTAIPEASSNIKLQGKLQLTIPAIDWLIAWMEDVD